MSIKKIEVPVEFAQQQRNHMIALVIKEAPLPQVLTKIIFDYVKGMEAREFNEACLIHDTIHSRLSFCANSLGCYPKADGKLVKKMKNQEMKWWRETHYMFIYIPSTLKEYLNQLGPMIVHLKKLEGDIRYFVQDPVIDEQFEFDIEDF